MQKEVEAIVGKRIRRGKVFMFQYLLLSATKIN